MCDPVTLTIASTALAAGGSVYGGIQQQKQSNYSAAVAAQNARLADNQAIQVQRQGEDEQRQLARRLAAVKGQQIADYASMGLDVASGTPLDVLSGTAIQAAEDAQRARQTTMDRAQGLFIDASNYRSQETAYKAQGQTAFMSGLIGAGSTILGGASKMKGFYDARNPTGVGTSTVGGSGSVFKGSNYRGFGPSGA